MIHTVKGFGIVNKAEVDGYLELSCFFHDPADFGTLISGCSAFSKTSLNIWKFTVHNSVHTHAKACAFQTHWCATGQPLLCAQESTVSTQMSGVTLGVQGATSRFHVHTCLLLCSAHAE